MIPAAKADKVKVPAQTSEEQPRHTGNAIPLLGGRLPLVQCFGLTTFSANNLCSAATIAFEMR